MNSILIASLAGFFTAVCWGSTDWLISKASKRFNKFEINFDVQLMSIVIMWPILLVVGKPLPNAHQMLVLALVAVMFIGAMLAFIKALSSGLAGVVVPLSNTYALITLVLSTIFIGSVFNHMQIVAIVCIVLGAVLLAYEKNKQKVSLRVLHQSTLFALAAASMWGIAFFAANTVVGDVSWQMITGVTSTYAALIAFVVLLVSSKPKHFAVAIKRSLSNRLALMAGVVAQVGAMSLYIGSDRSGSLVIPAVIASSAPLITSGLAAVYDKEKIGLVKRLGAVIVVGGIVILNLV